MEKLIEKLFDFNKIPTKFVLLLAILSGVLLFVPDYWLAVISLNAFKNEYSKYIGIVFLGSCVFLLFTLIVSIFNSLGSWMFRGKRQRQLINTIHNLDEHEKAVLREFLIKGKRTLQMPIDNATVIGLTSLGIIEQIPAVSFVYAHGADIPCMMSDIARNVIMVNPNLIGFPTMQEGVSAEKREELLNARPKWAVDNDIFGRN